MFAPVLRVSDPLHALTRQFDRLLFDLDLPRTKSAGPAFDIFDDGERFRLVADLPGLRSEDLEIEATEDRLVVRGTRRVEVPEGFSLHRRERGELRLERSFTFPNKINPDEVSAALTQGVLTITLAKRADLRPRSIAVRTQAA